MNKTALVEAVARQLGQGTSKAQAARAVKAVLLAMSQGLCRDRSISLSGFGTFEVRRRKGRTLRNPRTGKPMRIRATQRVAFKVGKALKGQL
ncbi:MAG: HU family DNA-binding protein [Planctomycetota bacterium]